mmetsp:Transcript_1927/g.3059  ORF Transcript_1927/g.3059 Transcript_1927/m.3059 type:complete len:125 (-) Transcript_1927:156-530(-)|eukprot:CAMPEP_0185018066 /NCGR_PEP_ID=MMETSP1103-20130426/915_1 /TAXON_ID=36769 /ORGANISM="Paraphysomonas bandaiensis, Strain Caron Lab Isolate" /LENGTH=124 /DNA_ID=CAMNT_0027547761 /DNA_START=47 /DNA_END=421 /DNA_ORIENTATION=-
MAELAYTGADKDQFAVSLAAIICADGGVDVTAENINTLLDKTGNSVAPYWAPLFAGVVEKAGGIQELLPSPAAAGGVAAVAVAAPAADGAAAASEAPKAAAPVEEEVDALEGGMDMFGGGGGDY